MERKPLDLEQLNNWTNNPEAKQKLEDAKHQQLVLAMKRDIAKIEHEAKVFQIEEDEEEVIVATQKGLPSDNELEAMRGLSREIDKLETELAKIKTERDTLLGALESQASTIERLENNAASYRNMTFWERLEFLFTGRI